LLAATGLEGARRGLEGARRGLEAAQRGLEACSLGDLFRFRQTVRCSDASQPANVRWRRKTTMPDVVARRIVRSDSPELRSVSTSTNRFLRHPQKKYLNADGARSLTPQALKLRD
jgi:hypothetical protein